MVTGMTYAGTDLTHSVLSQIPGLHWTIELYLLIFSPMFYIRMYVCICTSRCDNIRWKRQLPIQQAQAPLGVLQFSSSDGNTSFHTIFNAHKKQYNNLVTVAGNVGCDFYSSWFVYGHGRLSGDEEEVERPNNSICGKFFFNAGTMDWENYFWLIKLCYYCHYKSISLLLHYYYYYYSY